MTDTTHSPDPNETAVRRVVRDDAGRFTRGSARPPARRRGGQVGNLNSAKYPWRTFWSRRPLRPEHRWVTALVAGYVEDLVAQRGGDEAVSFAERKLMELAQAARVCWVLCLAGNEVKDAARFMSVERATLSDIGLERRPREVPSLGDYLKARAQRPAVVDAEAVRVPAEAPAANSPASPPEAAS